jgi:hypothetical protein
MRVIEPDSIRAMMWLAIGAVVWTAAALVVWALCVAAARADRAALAQTADRAATLDGHPGGAALPAPRAADDLDGWLVALGTVLDADVDLDLRPTAGRGRPGATRCIAVAIDAPGHREAAPALTARRSPAAAPFDATDRDLLALAARRLAALMTDAPPGMPVAEQPRFTRPSESRLERKPAPPRRARGAGH